MSGTGDDGCVGFTDVPPAPGSQGEPAELIATLPIAAYAMVTWGVPWIADLLRPLVAGVWGE